MPEILTRTYTGKKQPEPGARDANGCCLFPYLPSMALVEAVNTAIYLERPLLVMGEPGCGKTCLARAVAYELGNLPYFSWHIKSTSSARDGLYFYDAVRRLHDSQLASSCVADINEAAKRVADPMNYVRFGPLGQAFQSEQRPVVLIDEIDKADIDFPNDLLLELDEKRFTIDVTGSSVVSIFPPIVFVTSNDEKELPNAFLRRCLYFYIEFPTAEQLSAIVHAHIPSLPPPVMHAAVERFMEIRTAMQNDGSRSSKRISTSELLDWVRVLQQFPEDEALHKLNGKLPYPEVLLKSWDDHRRYLSETEYLP